MTWHGMAAGVLRIDSLAYHCIIIFIYGWMDGCRDKDYILLNDYI